MRSLGELPRGACPLFLRRGFTLVELLVTMTIITILAGMITFAMYRVQEMSRIEKTQALIARLNNIIMDRWDSYRTRRVPVMVLPTAPAARKLAARTRLDALHELMRLELPDRWTDVLDDPVTPATVLPSSPVQYIQRPSVSMEYLRRYKQVQSARGAAPSNENQAAECLYLIVMASISDDASPRDLFSPSEIGDVDNDGMPEFLDAWGNPISFLRWAPGFDSELQKNPLFHPAAELDADPSDPQHIYPWTSPDPSQKSYPWEPRQPQVTFALFPLIYSPGPDQSADIFTQRTDKELHYRDYNNNPYLGIPDASGKQDPAYGDPIGLRQDIDANGVDNSIDNIHNHLLGVRQ